MAMKTLGHSTPTGSRQAGFSLIELLVALVLGLMLTVGMISVFSGNQRSSELNTAIANLQEGARFALDTLARDVRMAGFQGCAPIGGGSVSVIAKTPPMTDTVEGLRATAIWGSRVESATSWEPMPPWGADFNVPVSNPAVAGSHVLALQFGDEKVYRLTQPVGGSSSANASGPIYLDGVLNSDIDNLDDGDLAIISDCVDGDLFRVSGVAANGSETVIQHAASDNASGTLGTVYGKSERLREQTMVMRFNSLVYYVGETGTLDEEGNPVTALFQQEPPFDGSNPPIELVQGVEQFQVSFEVSDGVGRRRTITAGNASFNPADVTAVRIGVLMASQDPIADEDDDTTYQLAGVQVPPRAAASADQTSHAGDKRFRLAFNTTIKVRNFRDTGN